MNFGTNWLALLIILELVLVETVPNKSKARHFADIVKRHLRWTTDKRIVSSDDALAIMRIEYLKPHEKSVPVSNTEGVYMAFTLYARDRGYTVGVGIFHVIDLETLASYQCDTNHANAYFYFYDKCPSDDTFIVASGWCYDGSRGGLVFNSNTFNSALMSYTDGSYYLNNDRTVNPIEQRLLTSCFNSWKENNFNLEWECSTANIPVSLGLTDDKRSAKGCNNCDDCFTPKRTTSKGAMHDTSARMFVLTILLILHI